MNSKKHMAVYRWAWLIVLTGACNPPEPPPYRYSDLGTEEAPLPPPPQAWYDASLAKGQADWRPFRKPESAAAQTAEAKPAKVEGEKEAAAEGGEAGSSDAEKEIRELAGDYNKAVAENDLEKATEFLNDAQAEYGPNVFAAVNKLVEQLKALKEAAPGLNERVESLAAPLNLPDVLKLELESVSIVDEKNATAKLVGGTEVKVVVGEEDFWYLESPGLTLLEKERSRIEKLAADIEAALAKGTPDEATLTAMGTALDELRTALSPAAAKPEGDSG